MAYSKQVDRTNPTCFIFLIDQSNSMLMGCAGSTRPIIEVCATAVNRILQELAIMCDKGEDRLRHYFDIGLIGYTTDDQGNPIVGSAFQGQLAGRDLVSIVELSENPLAIEDKKQFIDDGAGGLLERTIKVPVWYKAPAKEQMFGTPMCTAMNLAYALLSKWVQDYPDSLPPTVINLTDGEPNDGDPEPFSQALRSLSTSDGNVLMFNCHMSARTAESALFPTSESGLIDDYARALFRMSSELPEGMRRMAEIKGIATPPGCKAMAFNADSLTLLKLISVGTVIANPPAQAQGLLSDVSELPPHLR